MSQLSIKLFHKGGAALSSIPIDTAFGVSQDSSTGRIYLSPANRYVYVDSVGGNDANTGLSHAQRVQTLSRALTVWLGTGFTPGDILLVAEGTTLDDTSGAIGVGKMQGKGGAAAVAGVCAHPTAVQSYGPTDPTNTAKYGWAHGQNKPKLLCCTLPDAEGGWLYIGDDSGATNGIFFQGLRFDGQDTDHQFIGRIGRHDYMGWQNCIFDGIAPQSFDPTTGSIHHHMSLCSSAFMWESVRGNNSGLFTGGINNVFTRDNVYGHCGWSKNASREYDTAQGGSNVYSHGHYFGGDCTNGTLYLNLGFDNGGDDHSYRGSGTGIGLVSWDSPTPGSLTGFSNVYTEEPLGSVFNMKNLLVMGGADVKTGAIWQGPGAITAGNSALGTTLTDSAFLDYQFFADPPGTHDSWLISIGHTSGQIDLYAACNNIRSWNYAKYAIGQVNDANCHLTFTNCKNEATVGPAAGTGNTTWSGTPSGYKDRAAILSAMGFASREALFNMALEYPELVPWAQIILSYGLVGMGITPQYPIVTMPDLSAYPTPPQLYVPGATAPTLSSPTSSAITATTATIGSTTNQGAGTIYWIVTTDTGTPTIAQIRAGKNSAGAVATQSGSISVSSTGAKTASVTGLTHAVAYRYWFFHAEPSVSHYCSNVIGSTFTTT